MLSLEVKFDHRPVTVIKVQHPERCPNSQLPGSTPRTLSFLLSGRSWMLDDGDFTLTPSLILWCGSGLACPFHLCFIWSWVVMYGRSNSDQHSSHTNFWHLFTLLGSPSPLICHPYAEEVFYLVMVPVWHTIVTIFSMLYMIPKLSNSPISMSNNHCSHTGLV